jgi:hypothetical protein
MIRVLVLVVVCALAAAPAAHADAFIAALDALGSAEQPMRLTSPGAPAAARWA